MEILFELNHCYTQMDEDYSNRLTIYDDGSINAYQMETYCYQPESRNIDKPASNEFLDSIQALLKKHEKEIAEIPFTEIEPHWKFNMRVLDKQFSLLFLHRWYETNYDGTKNKRTQEDISKDFLIDLICSVKEIVEKYYPKEIKWNRFDTEYWFKELE